MAPIVPGHVTSLKPIIRIQAAGVHRLTVPVLLQNTTNAVTAHALVVIVGVLEV
ncbi:hypothetical protein KDI_36200 [Dictyobacter arantiisoli]|uniref:Uncharacterized protein n=1 Tax=Dictyobacter arantiisoli TaxID=2014874 RepID=A0A5A5TFX5_9CHLR|nr:hypothetical protein KDI_36200 [Dictyobacter arantiisoli]